MRYPYSLVVDFAPAKSSQNNWGNALAIVDTSARMISSGAKSLTNGKFGVGGGPTTYPPLGG